MKRKKQFNRTNIKSFKMERLIEFMFRFDTFHILGGTVHVKRSSKCRNGPSETDRRSNLVSVEI